MHKISQCITEVPVNLLRLSLTEKSIFPVVLFVPGKFFAPRQKPDRRQICCFLCYDCHVWTVLRPDPAACRQHHDAKSLKVWLSHRRTTASESKPSSASSSPLLSSYHASICSESAEFVGFVTVLPLLYHSALISSKACASKSLLSPV